MSIISLLGFLIFYCFIAAVVLVLAWMVGLLLNLLAGLLLGRVPWASRDRRKTLRVRPRIPPALRRAVLSRDGYVCQQCGSGESLEIDHIIAVSRGGATSLENLQVLCTRCNEEKGARP